MPLLIGYGKGSKFPKMSKVGKLNKKIKGSTKMGKIDAGFYGHTLPSQFNRSEIITTTGGIK